MTAADDTDAEDQDNVTHFGHNPTQIVHTTSRGTMLGLCTSWNKSACRFYIHFPTCETYEFSASSGKGMEPRVRMWKIPVDELRRLRGEPGYKVPAPRKPRAKKPAEPKPADPRQLLLVVLP